MQSFRVHLTHLYAIGLGNMFGNYIKYIIFFDLTNAYCVSHFHIIINWILKMANVSAQKMVFGTPFWLLPTNLRCLGPMNRTKHFLWHPKRSQCPDKIRNNVCQHKWIWEPHLLLSLTTLRIQPFISTLCLLHSSINACH